LAFSGYGLSFFQLADFLRNPNILRKLKISQVHTSAFLFDCCCRAALGIMSLCGAAAALLGRHITVRRCCRPGINFFSVETSLSTPPLFPFSSLVMTHHCHGRA
jgi:hypothetical protein